MTVATSTIGIEAGLSLAIMNAAIARTMPIMSFNGMNSITFIFEYGVALALVGNMLVSLLAVVLITTSEGDGIVTIAI